jgi:hypothetical protein
MENINKLFKNIVNDLSHEELMHYITNVLDEEEKRVILLNLNLERKEEIIENEMNLAINKISGQYNNMMDSVIEDVKNIEHKKYLRSLELKFKLLQVTECIANHAKDNKLLLETNNQLCEVVTVYKMEGGNNMFYAK